MRTLMMLLLSVCGMELAWASDTIERTVAADPHGTVEISNISGRIEVSAWDTPQVQVRAAHADPSSLTVENDQGRVTVKVNIPMGISFGGHSETDLYVKVPRESELEVNGVSSDVVVTDVQGPLHLKTVSGSIKTDAFQRDVEAKAFSGQVTVNARAPGAHLHLTNISGGIKVDHGAGDLEATSVSGDVILHLDSMKNLRIHTTSSDVAIEGKLLRGGNIEADTVSGGMKVRVVPDTGFDYDISTFSGDIDNCMGIKAEHASRYGPGSRLRGTVGQSSDDTQVRLKSMSGDIDLCDKR